MSPLQEVFMQVLGMVMITFTLGMVMITFTLSYHKWHWFFWKGKPPFNRITKDFGGIFTQDS